MAPSQTLSSLQPRAEERDAHAYTAGDPLHKLVAPNLSRAIPICQKLPVITSRKKLPRRRQPRLQRASHLSASNLTIHPFPLPNSLTPPDGSANSSWVDSTGDDTDWTEFEDLIPLQTYHGLVLSKGVKALLQADESDADQMRSVMVRNYRPQTRYSPGNPKADPFNCFPLHLNELDARLLDFHIHDYARATYAMSPKLRVGMRFFKEIMTSQVELHATLSQAASALSYQKNSATSIDHRQLQVAALHHKVEAIRAINQALQLAISQDVISATISIARDELRNGSREISQMHFAAVRCMIGSLGGRSKMTLPYLIVQARGIECTFTSPEISCFFDRNGLQGRIQTLRDFIDQLQCVRTVRSLSRVYLFTPNRLEEPLWQVLQPDSLFHALLSQEVPDPRTVLDSEVAAVHAQLAILVGMATAWLQAEDVTLVRNWIVLRNTVLEEVGIKKHETILNANNFLLPGTDDSRIRDLSQAWSLIDMMNAIRHLGFTTKLQLRNWVLRLLEGCNPGPCPKLDAFAFSYMAP